jgi:4-amino-4-deoxy-L-arabinose transferase-like glycosyltransferase
MKILTRISWGLWGIAFVVLLFAFLVYSMYAYNLASFPLDYDQGEGFELVDTIMFSQFEMPYRDTESFPFYASNYPPLYHVLLAPFVWFFGNNYWYGRLFSYATTLITAWVIGRVIWKQTGIKHIAILSGLAFLSSNTIYHNGALFRQHISMVMFEALAVVVLANAFPKRNTKQIALGFFLLICAGYTKQLAAFSAIAVLLWAFLQNPRRAILWGLGFAVAGSAVFLWLNVVTDGEWWRQAIVANAGRVNLSQSWGLGMLFAQLHGFLFYPALVYAVYELYRERISLYTVWLLVTLLLGGMSSGTWGGGDSYYSTAIAASCLVGGLALARLWQARTRLHPLLGAVVVLGLPLVFIGYGRATFKMPTDGMFAPLAELLNVEPNIRGRHFDSATYNVLGYSHIGHWLTPEDFANGELIVQRVRASVKPVLSEEAGFSLQAGREVITNPTQLLNLDIAGLFVGDELVRMIRDQEFSFIIFRAKFYPVRVLKAVDDHYRYKDSIIMNGFEYMFYYPRRAGDHFIRQPD